MSVGKHAASGFGPMVIEIKIIRAELGWMSQINQGIVAAIVVYPS
jgi:hypothetical protein